MADAHDLDRLLILGLDGATWTVLDPFRQRGFLPNLDALLKRSAHGTLRSTIPPVTSAAWTTMMTGCRPGRHGVFDHRYFDGATGRMRVNNSSRVRVPTFWQTLSGLGRSVISLNLPVTYPPLRVKGIVVSGIDAPHLDAALSSAPEFAQRLRAEVPGYHLQVLWKKPPTDLAELQSLGAETTKLFHSEARAGYLADEMVPDWSVLMVQFQLLDPFQHRCWRALNVDSTGNGDESWTNAAGSVLRGLDQAIGELCELADRRGAGVLAVSDHGFGPCLGRISVNRVLQDGGIVQLPSLSGKIRQAIGKGAERVRLWSEKRDDPTARSSTFDVSLSSLLPFDWSRTLAFAPHQDTAAMVYLNSTDRNPSAPLKTPRQRDDALRQIRQVLSEARDHALAGPLFPLLVNVAEEYGIDPAREGYPDVIALPDEAYWVRTKFQPKAAWIEPDPSLPGTHRMEGIVMLSAPGVTPGRTLNAQLQDVTPSILCLLGVPIPGQVEGRPFDCLSTATSSRRDEPRPSVLQGPHQPAFEYDDAEQSLIEQRLAELGYLE